MAGPRYAKEQNGREAHESCPQGGANFVRERAVDGLFEGYVRQHEELSREED